MYQVIKTYGHDLGWSAIFRQPFASSHCRWLHGYPLAFRLLFEAETLDSNNWVIDFGSLKPIKDWLQETFDHRLLIAENDPMLDSLALLEQDDLASHLVVPSVGCEGFAKYVYDHVAEWLFSLDLPNDPRLVSVEVAEHGANSAIYHARSITYAKAN